MHSRVIRMFHATDAFDGESSPRSAPLPRPAGDETDGPGTTDRGDPRSRGEGRGRGRGRFGGPGFGEAGFGPGFGPGFGGPGFGGPGFGRRGGGRGRGGRARRGDVRAAVLALLAERPMHGYEIINELGDRTSGMWRPSAGSVYPTLQLLEDEGRVVGVDVDGKRRYTLTASGQAELEASGDRTPWDRVAGDAGSEAVAVRESLAKMVMAWKQVASNGTDEQQRKAVDVLNDARRKLYAILAEE